MDEDIVEFVLWSFAALVTTVVGTFVVRWAQHVADIAFVRLWPNPDTEIEADDDGELIELELEEDDDDYE